MDGRPKRNHRLENKRTGVLSSRPGWGLEESIENWDGVYLDTEDRVVALDVDGDPENRQAVLIGEKSSRAREGGRRRPMEGGGGGAMDSTR